MTKKIKTRVEETTAGTILYNVPFPKNLKELKEMSPIVIKHPYSIDYVHSYGQDSPWFAGLANKKLLGTQCQKCGHTFATPKLSCMECGGECDWVELPQEGKIHSFTVCHFGAEAFLNETPFILGLIEFNGADTLLMTRLLGLDPEQPTLDWVGKKVKAKFVRKSQFKPTDVYFVPA